MYGVFGVVVFFLMIRRPPRSTLFPYNDALPIFSRRDVIIVASVSCIYGLGSPEMYREMLIDIAQGMECRRDNLLMHLVEDRKSTRLNSSHANISYAVFCLKKNNYMPVLSASSMN